MDHQTAFPQTLETDAYRRTEYGEHDWTTVEEKAEFYGEMKEFARKKGYKPGFAAMKFKARFYVWPDDPRIKNAPEREMSVQTLLWMKCQQEDYWKQKQREKRAAARG